MKEKNYVDISKQWLAAITKEAREDNLLHNRF